MSSSKLVVRGWCFGGKLLPLKFGHGDFPTKLL